MSEEGEETEQRRAEEMVTEQRQDMSEDRAEVERATSMAPLKPGRYLLTGNRPKESENVITTRDRPEEIKESENDLILHLLKCASQAERREARMTFNISCATLGCGQVCRRGTTKHLMWSDNQQTLDLNLQLEKVQKKKEAIVEQQNLKMQRADKGKNVVDTGAVNKEDCFYPDEYYKARLASINREEAMITEQKTRHRLEKNLLEFEMNRIAAEDSSHFNNFPVLSGRYALLNLLAKEEWREVYKCFDLVERTYVACKLHMIDALKISSKSAYLKNAIKVNELFKGMVHKNIVRLKDVFLVGDDTYCTVLEYCSGKDLQSMLLSKRVIPEEDARTIIIQIFHALASQQFCHCNLKPSNVLFDELGDVKITDFGLRITGPTGKQQLMFPAALKYIPPEILSQSCVMTEKVDVWSCGILLYEMIFGYHPFKGNLTVDEYKRNLGTEEVKFPSESSISDNAKEFIRYCLTLDEAKRPDRETMSQHSFLTYLNLDLEL